MMGPGVISAIEIICVNSSIVIQPLETISSWRRGIIASPPPMVNSPTFANTRSGGISIRRLPFLAAFRVLP